MYLFTRGQTGLQCRKGFTLTELAIVLSIMGTILGAIWSAASHVYTNQKITKTAQQVLTLAQGIRSLYANKVAIDTGDLTQLAVNANLYPPDMLRNTACSGTGTLEPVATAGFCPLDPFNGEMSVINAASQTVGGYTGTTNQFEINLWGLGSAHCAAVLSAIIPQAVSGGGLVGISSSANTTTGIAYKAVSPTTSLTGAEIQGCGGDVTLIFSL